MEPESRRVDHVGIEPAHSFASVCYPDAHPGPGRRRHQSRPQQPLEINRQLEAARTQALEKLGMSPQFPTSRFPELPRS